MLVSQLFCTVFLLFRYVSTQYIHDCIEKNEQLKMEAYRLNPETLQANSAKLNNSKDGSPGFSGGVVSMFAFKLIVFISVVGFYAMFLYFSILNR